LKSNDFVKRDCEPTFNVKPCLAKKMIGKLTTIEKNHKN